MESAKNTVLSLVLEIKDYFYTDGLRTDFNGVH